MLMNRLIAVTLNVVFCLMGLAVRAQNTPWKLEKDKNGIQVFSRLPEGSRFKEMKVICEIDGTMSQLCAYVSDVEHYPEVVYKNKQAYLIKRINEREMLYYNETMLPWPVKNRDLVIHLTFIPDAAKKELRIHTENAAGYVAVQSDKVRVPYWRADWTVVKRGPDRLGIEYVFRVDPGGEIPAWVINMTAAVGPYTSFSGMEGFLKLPRYQNRQFSFLNF
ncbi:hypothetical protein BLX24_25785 [Arsenicibacter rosenii]|uniref:START domain-containing protein n=2 Tax=Arsenicibacter rosenii TaxID=1750698 RepID=A0A1S2VBX9_9BACT|nr:hypothetical protein BLX24_25785 [Arsenicibacter rosenii]